MTEKNQIHSTSREEWLRARHACFGASDAPMVMGRSQYGSRESLIDEKAHPLEIESNPWLEKEKDEGEKEAVKAYLMQTNVVIEYQVMLVAQVKGISRPLSCTLDALVKFLDISGSTAIEVKCVKERSAGDDVPAQYFHQLLHQQIVLSSIPEYRDVNILYIEYCKETKQILKRVYVNESLPYKRELIRAYKRAEADIAKQRKKEAMGVAEGTKVRLYNLSDKYAELLPKIEEKSREIEELKKHADNIRSQISSLVGDQEFKFSHQGLKVAKVKVKGAIDIDRLPLYLSIDEYRKPSTYSVRITKERAKKMVDEHLDFHGGAMHLR